MMCRRRAAAVLLAAFAVSVFSLWIHDHVGHGAATPLCTEAPGHFCTEEGHHRADPCVFCSLRASGQEPEGGGALALPFLPAVPCEVPHGTPVFGVPLPLPPQRGPPAA